MLLDTTFIAQTVIPTLNKGLLVSIALIIPSGIIGCILGICIGTIRVFGKRWLQRLGNVFTLAFRGVPLTVQLMILYFGLPNLDIYLEPYLAALIGFTLCTGAYQSEYIRGALLSIKKGQLQAAYALGFSRLKAILFIITPQAIRYALPGCGNEFIYLIKYSSLAYLITCIELTGEAKILVAQTVRPIEIYFIAAIYYLFFVSITTLVLKKIEISYAIPGIGIKHVDYS